MAHAKIALYCVLAVFGLLFIGGWLRAAREARARDAAAGVVRGSPIRWLYQGLVGVVTDFLDTLGIGSFATTTALLRAGRAIDDRLLPGTLNVSHTLATILQAYLYIDSVKVDPKTLVLMIAAATAGSWLGAPVVAKWSRRKVQLVMGIALIVAAGIFAATAWRDWLAAHHLDFAVLPVGGSDLALTGTRLGIGIAVNFALGAIMTMGIGLYAPCMVLVSLLQMDQKAAFPIMMGSCAFLMPIASLRFMRLHAFDSRASLAITLGGVPAVVLAWWWFNSLDVSVVRKVVVAVVAYTAVSLLLAARRPDAESSRQSHPGAPAT